MDTCQISRPLAYLASLYILASVYYLTVSRTYGTPFKDAVEQIPELKKIKLESVRKRSQLFYAGVLLSLLILAIFRPFG